LRRFNHYCGNTLAGWIVRLLHYASAAQGKYDDFLNCPSSEANWRVANPQGFRSILNDEEGGYARQQANELLESRSVSGSVTSPLPPSTEQGRVTKN
jgi:hypothetical protein